MRRLAGCACLAAGVRAAEVQQFPPYPDVGKAVQWGSLFRRMDTSADGALSVDELAPHLEAGHHLMNSRGRLEAQPAMSSFVRSQFEALDRDGDGSLRTAELPDAMLAGLEASLLFSFADADGSGSLSSKEYLVFLYPDFATNHTRYFEYQAKLHIAHCDTDRDLKVTSTEFDACDSSGAEGAEADEHSRAATKRRRAHFLEADANGDGALELSELGRFQSLVENIDKRKEALELVKVGDENGDGVLSPSEVQNGVLKLPKLQAFFREQALHTEL